MNKTSTNNIAKKINKGFMPSQINGRLIFSEKDDLYKSKIKQQKSYTAPEIPVVRSAKDVLQIFLLNGIH